MMTHCLEQFRLAGDVNLAIRDLPGVGRCTNNLFYT